MDENDEVHGNLATCEKIMFYEREWLHVVQKIDDFFCEKFCSLNESKNLVLRVQCFNELLSATKLVFIT